MEDRCVSCGAIIPERRQVCESCEKGNRKFTDDEVIKALECCNDDGSCDNCPFDGVRKEDAWCVDVLNEATRTLINRQKAEIERLNAIAIKEFAERLKKRLERKYTIYGREYVLRHLRELEKEMTEGGGADA